MKFSLTKRRQWLLGTGAALLLTATPRSKPACCRLKVSVPFLTGRPEGPRRLPLTVPAYAVLVAMITTSRPFIFNMV